MIFKPTLFNRISVLIMCLFGVLILILFLFVFIDADEAFHVSNVLVLIVLLGFFVGLSIIGVRSFKTAKRNSGEWIFTFAYRKKVVHLNKENVLKINITEKGVISKLIFGNIITLKTKQGEQVLLNSREMTNFKELSALLSSDFPDNVTILKGIL
ncbi:MAG: hypothetical protein GQ574_00725 [Crocinitomix sp.]|nr:hypothetical protein [Crocinitomix sp.]